MSDVRNNGSGRHRSRKTETTSAPTKVFVVVPEGTSEQAVYEELFGQGLPRKTTEAKFVALTFDDGPSEYTHDILDILEENDARATFFVLGDHITGREEEIQRMVDLGCEIGNHTMSHPDLSTLGKYETLEELATCSQLIQAVSLKIPHVYRAPFLHDTPNAKIAGLALNMISISCDVVAEDWVITDPREIVNRVLWGVKQCQGSIVLLHDGSPDDRTASRQPTVDAVRELVPQLIKDGYELVTMRDIIDV